MRAITTTALAMLIIAGAGMTTGCNSMRQTNKPATPENARPVTGASSSTQSVASELIGDWAIIDVKGHQVVSNDAEYPHMGFATNQDNPGWIDFYAYNGCNFINGVVALKGSKIAKQGDFAATMRLCADAKYEMAISTALEQMKTLRIDKINNESFLYLIDGSGQTLMTLRKHNLNFLEGAWRIMQIDSARLPEGVDIQVVIDLQTNTIHGNAGCNVLNGLVKINMDVENGIGFTDLATTRMTCPHIAYESQFLQALGKVATATGNDSRAQLRDAQGNVIIEMERLSKADLASDR